MREQNCQGLGVEEGFAVGNLWIQRGPMWRPPLWSLFGDDIRKCGFFCHVTIPDRPPTVANFLAHRAFVNVSLMGLLISYL